MRVGKKGSEKNSPCFALFCFVLKRSEKIWGEGFGPREPPSLGFRDLPEIPDFAHRPGKIERQLERVASPATTVVPDGERVDAQHRCGDAAEGAGTGREDRLEVHKADAEEGPAAGFARPPAGQYAALVGKLPQLQLEDSGAGRALLHRDEGRREGSRQLSGRPRFRPRARREGAEGRGTLPAAKVPPVTVAPNQRRYGTRLPFPGASLFPPARPEAGSVRDTASPCVRPPEESLKNQAPLGAFLTPRLLTSSVQIAAVGNPGEGVWAAAALRTCPRANPGDASRLVPGDTALRRLELRLLASCSQLALSAATETCALGSLPYMYWLLSSQPVTHSWSLSPPLRASSCYSPSAARRGPPPPQSPPLPASQSGTGPRLSVPLSAYGSPSSAPAEKTSSPQSQSYARRPLQ